VGTHDIKGRSISSHGSNAGKLSDKYKQPDNLFASTEGLEPMLTAGFHAHRSEWQNPGVI